MTYANWKKYLNLPTTIFCISLNVYSYTAHAFEENEPYIVKTYLGRAFLTLTPKKAHDSERYKGVYERGCGDPSTGKRLFTFQRESELSNIYFMKCNGVSLRFSKGAFICADNSNAPQVYINKSNTPHGCYYINLRTGEFMNANGADTNSNKHNISFKKKANGGWHDHKVFEISLYNTTIFGKDTFYKIINPLKQTYLRIENSVNGQYTAVCKKDFDSHDSSYLFSFQKESEFSNVYFVKYNEAFLRFSKGKFTLENSTAPRLRINMYHNSKDSKGNTCFMIDTGDNHFMNAEHANTNSKEHKILFKKGVTDWHEHRIFKIVPQIIEQASSLDDYTLGVKAQEEGNLAQAVQYFQKSYNQGHLKEDIFNRLTSEEFWDYRLSKIEKFNIVSPSFDMEIGEVFVSKGETYTWESSAHNSAKTLLIRCGFNGSFYGMAPTLKDGAQKLSLREIIENIHRSPMRSPFIFLGDNSLHRFYNSWVMGEICLDSDNETSKITLDSSDQSLLLHPSVAVTSIKDDIRGFQDTLGDFQRTLRFLGGNTNDRIDAMMREVARMNGIADNLVNKIPKCSIQ